MRVRALSASPATTGGGEEWSASISGVSERLKRLPRTLQDVIGATNHFAILGLSVPEADDLGNALWDCDEKAIKRAFKIVSFFFYCIVLDALEPPSVSLAISKYASRQEHKPPRGRPQSIRE